ncbi:toprim domain-containing protein [Methylobacterium sp. J-001]|uniref:DUF7146 domain-containing protein n=1 Tax=Methylobacterium sp. J-001 TaxID=2836609 RepID=UPI001FBC0BA1|nr:toprim domain-containing protein [Methylobacterium sp. J-001]MCJ2120650.1 toprim domain-containing protein [Methylobacterium sp. J-001]
MMDLRSAARALGGEVVGRGIVCPGPHHSRQDRSLSILFDASAPGGFTLHSHAGDDFGSCRDFVRERLGLSGQVASKPAQVEPVSAALIQGGNEPLPPSASDRTALALRIWREARQPAESPVARHLARRGLDLIPDIHEVLRFHPSCPFAGNRTRAMVALVRNIVTNEPQAIHRTALSLDGQKVEVNGKDRLALGSIRGAAVKLTADEEVTLALGIGEGLESSLSLRCLPEFGASPVWSLLNAAGIASFPALPGIEVLWIAVDDDPAGRGASELCADRWRRAGKEVFLVQATASGTDLNDVAMEVANG